MFAAIMQSKREAELASVVVPDEPPADADPNSVCTIRIRSSKYGTMMRRFDREKHTVGDVINFFKKQSGKGLGD